MSYSTSSWGWGGSRCARYSGWASLSRSQRWSCNTWFRTLGQGACMVVLLNEASKPSNSLTTYSPSPMSLVRMTSLSSLFTFQPRSRHDCAGGRISSPRSESQWLQFCPLVYLLEQWNVFAVLVSAAQLCQPLRNPVVHLPVLQHSHQEIAIDCRGSCRECHRPQRNTCLCGCLTKTLGPWWSSKPLTSPSWFSWELM